MNSEQQLRIRVCSARVQAIDCTSCFAIVEYSGVSWRTKAKSGKSPMWNQSFMVPLNDDGEITVSIKTRDRFGKLSIEGVCALPHYSTLKNQFADLWLDFGLGFPLQACHVCMQQVVIAPATATTAVVKTNNRKSLLRRMSSSRTPSPSPNSSRELSSVENQLMLVELYAELDEIRRIIYLAGVNNNSEDAMMRSSELNTCLNNLWRVKERVANVTVDDENVRNKLVALIEEYTRDCNLMLNDRAMRELTEQVQSVSVVTVDQQLDDEEEEDSAIVKDEWKPHFVSSLAAFDRLLDFGFVVECFRDGKRIEREVVGGDESAVQFSSWTVYVYDAATMRAYKFSDERLDVILQNGELTTESTLLPRGLLLGLKEIPHNTNLAVITITPELAFGANPAPFDILPNSHLVIELVDVERH